MITMKKQLTNDDIKNLPFETNVLIVENGTRRSGRIYDNSDYSNYILISIDKKCYIYFPDDVKSGKIKVYEYIPSKIEREENKLENKIDYDKKYKGWKILKLIDEKVLKAGSIVEYFEDKYTKKMYISESNVLRFCNDNQEVKNSYLSSSHPHYFKILKQEKPLTFQEILDEKYNGKKFRIEDKEDLSFKDYINTSNYDTLANLLENIAGKFHDYDLRKILNEAKFYVEE